jgi:hypothetical protein
MRRPFSLFAVPERAVGQVLPCVSALACGAETPFSLLTPHFLLTKETVR